MSQHDIFNRVLASLHEAMLDDAHWPATSALIDDACGIKGSALVVGKGHSQADGQIFFGRFCYHGQRYEDRERWYFDNYYPYDERVPRVAKLPDSRLVHIPDLYTEEELKTSLAYNEAFPRGSYQNGLNVRMDGPDGSHIVWTLADSTEPGGWGWAQTEMIEHLLPHIRQFVRVRQALAGVEALGASLTGLLDNTRVAVIHLDLQGRVAAANDRARGILRQGDGLFDRGGFLAAWSPADNARLKRLLAHALPTGGGQAVSGSMTVGRLPGLPRLAVHVSPVDARQMDFGTQRVAALVLALDPEFQSDIDPGLVAATLGLTPAESRVAVWLAEGKSVRDIAVATGRQADRPTGRQADRPTGRQADRPTGRQADRPTGRQADRPTGKFCPLSHQADTSQARHFAACGLGALGAVARRLFGLPALKPPSGRWT
jgi:PAS domain-containing protein